MFFSASHDSPLSSGSATPAGDVAYLGRTQAWIIIGSQHYSIELRSVAFSGGTAQSSHSFTIGDLTRMLIQDDDKQVALCVQITSCANSQLSFRLYGTSGVPKRVWEDFVNRVKSA